MADAYLVQPVFKAMQVLRCLGEERRELTLSEICHLVNLPKTTVFRYLYTLAQCGFVYHDPETELYRIGIRMWELSKLSSELSEVRDLALPVMRELRDQFNETINLGILDGPEVVYLEMVESRRSLRMQAKIGNRDPIYATALGKALLAFVAEERWPEHIPPALVARTAHTLTTLTLLRNDLLQTRRQGYALDNEENEEGARCVSAPIFNHAGLPVAAISLSAPTTRFNVRQAAKVGKVLAAAGQRISAQLGFGAGQVGVTEPFEDATDGSCVGEQPPTQ